jgi:hypothetical protein
MALDSERNLPIERQWIVGEVSANLRPSGL